MSTVTFADQLDIYLRARFPLLILVTSEEERALQSAKKLCESSSRAALSWDIAEGFQVLALAGATTKLSANDPLTALDLTEKADGTALFLLKDFHECWNNPQIKRKLRSTVQRQVHQEIHPDHDADQQDSRGVARRGGHDRVRAADAG